MASHTHYWSCSKFGDWIRGTAKLQSGTSEEWDKWNDDAERHSPFRFWMAEEALGKIQDFVTWPTRSIYAVKYYINNRWVTRTHSLTASRVDIKPGNWCDVGNRFLPCLFNELVDFVEVELAWFNIAWSEDGRKKYNAPFYSFGWFRWRVWRCKQAGIDNLDWQRSLKHDDEWLKDKPYYGKLTDQAIKAQEVLDLYYWWTEVYRKRPDPYDASGWSASCEAQRLAKGGKFSFTLPKDPVLRKQADKASKLLSKIEADYENEDTLMLIRLIRVRHGLWT